MQVHVDAILFLLQPRDRLLHVVRHRVLGDVGLAFCLVVSLGLDEEGFLKRLLVDVEVGALRVGLVESEGDKGFDGFLDE